MKCVGCRAGVEHTSAWVITEQVNLVDVGTEEFGQSYRLRFSVPW